MNSQKALVVILVSHALLLMVTIIPYFSHFWIVVLNVVCLIKGDRNDLVAFEIMLNVRDVDSQPILIFIFYFFACA